MVEFLLSKGMKASESGVLNLAVKHSLALTEMLIDRGADVNAGGEHNWTPLPVSEGDTE